MTSNSHSWQPFLSLLYVPATLLLPCSASASFTPVDRPPPLPVRVTCYRGKSNADITLIMQFHQPGAGRAAFYSNHSETTGHWSLHICPERERASKRESVLQQWRVYAVKHVCMFMSDTNTWNSHRGERGRNTAVTQGQVAAQAEGWCTSLSLTHTHKHTIQRKRESGRQGWLVKVSWGALKHMFPIRKFDSLCYNAPGSQICKVT